MNLSSLLAYGPKLTRKQVQSTRGQHLHTPEASARWHAVMKEKRHAKWGGHFKQFPDMTATTSQITKLEGQDPSAVYRALKLLSKEEPPAVAMVGRVPPSKGNGRPQIVWKWIGE